MKQFYYILFLVFSFGFNTLFSQDLITNWRQGFSVPNEPIRELIANSISRDLNGNTYLSGAYQGQFDVAGIFGEWNLPFHNFGSSNGFIAKYNNWGGLEWSYHLRAITEESKIIVDKDGDVVCYFDVTTNMFNNDGNIYLINQNDSLEIAPKDSLDRSAILMLKFNSHGDLLWHKTFGRYDQQYTSNWVMAGSVLAFSIAIDSNNNYHVAGTGSGAIELNDDYSGPEISTGHEQALYFVLDEDGNYISSKIFDGSFDNGGNPRASIKDVSIGSDYVAFAGRFKGKIDFDPSAGTDSISSINGESTFFTILDANGDYIRTLVYPINPGNTGVSHDPQIYANDYDEFYLSSYFMGTIDLDQGSSQALISSKGEEDFFILKVNPSGDLMWKKIIGGTGEDYISDLQSNDGDQIYASGVFSDTIYIASDPIVELAAGDGFLLEFDSSGVSSNFHQFGSRFRETCNKVVIDDYSVTVLGYFLDSLNIDLSGGTDWILNPDLTPPYSNNIWHGFFLANYSPGFLGTGQGGQKYDVILYPNPTNNVIKVSGIDDKTRVRIFNTQGKLLKQIENFSDGSIDFSTFDTGIYILSIELDGQIITKRIIRS